MKNLFPFCRLYDPCSIHTEQSSVLRLVFIRTSFLIGEWSRNSWLFSYQKLFSLKKYVGNPKPRICLHNMKQNSVWITRERLTNISTNTSYIIHFNIYSLWSLWRTLQSYSQKIELHLRREHFSLPESRQSNTSCTYLSALTESSQIVKFYRV